MNDQIEVGDTVTVSVEGEHFQGIVLYMPQSTGDCWHIRENYEHRGTDDQPLHYVQTFEQIVLRKKAAR